MRFLDGMIIIVLFVLVGLASYVLWINFPDEPLKFEDFKFNRAATIDIPVNNKVQFYSNMRYKDRKISYDISNSCDSSRRNDAIRAFSVISEETVLQFYEANSESEIKILCSDIAPRPEEAGHFVAGEGGPSEIINTTNYAVILSGKISLFRKNDCPNPNIAIHEILHALGFDHNDNQKSVMYPLTECDQSIDDYIVEEINKLYKADSLPDLAIESVIANKTGRYLNFEIDIINLGLENSESSELYIYTEEILVKSFDLELMEIGTRKTLTVHNLAIPRKAESLSFEIKTTEGESDKNNNIVNLKLVKSE